MRESRDEHGLPKPRAIGSDMPAPLIWAEGSITPADWGSSVDLRVAPSPWLTALGSTLVLALVAVSLLGAGMGPGGTWLLLVAAAAIAFGAVKAMQGGLERLEAVVVGAIRAAESEPAD